MSDFMCSTEENFKDKKKKTLIVCGNCEEDFCIEMSVPLCPSCKELKYDQPHCDKCNAALDKKLREFMENGKKKKGGKP